MSICSLGGVVLCHGPKHPTVPSLSHLRAKGIGLPRGLAGKPLAGFRATPDRRIIVLYGMIVSVIRFKNPLLHR